ncbi:hypothetical protein K5M35_09145, partial [Chromobacterium vaccinii]|nr:hypothetical protein [Chromobacterium vaccinii]
MTTETLNIKRNISQHLNSGDPDILKHIFFEKKAHPIECEILDYKGGQEAVSYEDTIKQVISFHNSFGGFIIYGVTEIIKEHEFAVVGIEQHFIDSKKLRDLIKS